MDRYAIIVAGGSGSRMGSAVPKQFLELDGLPILMYTLKKFADLSYDVKIILVLPDNEISNWYDLVGKHDFTVPHIVVRGGATRFNSVKNGLMKVPANALVAIHDGVRPFASRELITKCFDSAENTGSGVAVVVPKDSIRKISGDESYNVERSAFRLMQTPQTFQSDLIKAAFANHSDTRATDDATIAENSGMKINLIEGDYRNIKITTPEDITIAQALLNTKLVP